MSTDRDVHPECGVAFHVYRNLHPKVCYVCSYSGISFVLCCSLNSVPPRGRIAVPRLRYRGLFLSDNCGSLTRRPLSSAELPPYARQCPHVRCPVRDTKPHSGLSASPRMPRPPSECSSGVRHVQTGSGWFNSMPVPHDGPSITLQQCLELFMIDRRDLASRRIYLVCSTQPQHVAALRPAVRVSWLILTPPICCPGLATGAIVRVSSAGAHDVGRHFLGPDLDVPSPEIAQSHHPPIKSLLSYTSIYIPVMAMTQPLSTRPAVHSVLCCVAGMCGAHTSDMCSTSMVSFVTSDSFSCWLRCRAIHPECVPPLRAALAYRRWFNHDAHYCYEPGAQKHS